MINTPVFICETCGEIVHSPMVHEVKDGCGPVRFTKVREGSATHEVVESRDSDGKGGSGITPVSATTYYNRVKVIEREFNQPDQMVHLPSARSKKEVIDFTAYFRRLGSQDRGLFQSGFNDAKNGRIDYSTMEWSESYSMGVRKHENSI